MTRRPLRWGIIGTGRIAGEFATGLRSTTDRLVAVGSRTQVGAERFGAAYDIPQRHGSYEALAADPNVDAVYVATPHNGHYTESLRCLEHGKAVLCEKPFTINAREADMLVRVARERGLFLMEAMWTRFLPLIVHVRELLAEGAIGEPRMLWADFGFRTGVNPASRLFDPALGGGALLDVGVYCVSIASMLFGEPVQIATLANLGETGIDEQNGTVLRYAAGQMALLSSAVRTTTPMETTIMGTDGMIRIHSPSWKPTRLTLSRPGADPLTVERPITGNGYNYEALEVAECLEAGKTESAVMPLDETLAIMRTMDAMRAEWGLKYPME